MSNIVAILVKNFFITKHTQPIALGTNTYSEGEEKIVFLPLFNHARWVWQDSLNCKAGEII